MRRGRRGRRGAAAGGSEGLAAQRAQRRPPAGGRCPQRAAPCQRQSKGGLFSERPGPPRLGPRGAALHLPVGLPAGCTGASVRPTVHRPSTRSRRGEWREWGHYGALRAQPRPVALWNIAVPFRPQEHISGIGCCMCERCERCEPCERRCASAASAASALLTVTSLRTGRAAPWRPRGLGDGHNRSY